MEVIVRGNEREINNELIEAVSRFFTDLILKETEEKKDAHTRTH